METNIVRPRRSALYLPSSNARAIQKAASLDCDVIIFDLEDAVGPDEKCTARLQACDAVRRGGFGPRELVVRINGVGTAWYEEDLTSVLAAGPDAILLPKVESPETVRVAARALRAAGMDRKTRLWCMLETPMGVLSASQVAAADECVECLVMGTSDLTKDLHARHTRSRAPLLTSLELCLLAARAFNKSILDGVCLELEDLDALHESCEQGRDLGFDGKTLIHPRQIPPCNASFSPTPTEVERAEAVHAAFAAARAAGRGVAVFEGKLVEELHVREAERILALDRAIRLRSAHSSNSFESTTQNPTP